MNLTPTSAFARSRTPNAPMPAFHKKSFIPGYAAFVPQIQHLFGISQGQMERVLKKKNGVKTFLYGTKEKGELLLAANKTTGYDGHMQGITSENLHGRPFDALQKKSNKIHIKRLKLAKSPLSTMMATFKLSRHHKQMKGRNLPNYMDKDYTDYAKFINKKLKNASIRENISHPKKAIRDSIFVSDQQERTALNRTFFNDRTQRSFSVSRTRCPSRIDTESQIRSIRPHLLERGITASPNFGRVSPTMIERCFPRED